MEIRPSLPLTRGASQMQSRTFTARRKKCGDRSRMSQASWRGQRKFRYFLNVVVFIDDHSYNLLALHTVAFSPKCWNWHNAWFCVHWCVPFTRARLVLPVANVPKRLTRSSVCPKSCRPFRRGSLDIRGICLSQGTTSAESVQHVSRDWITSRTCLWAITGKTLFLRQCVSLLYAYYISEVS